MKLMMRLLLAALLVYLGGMFLLVRVDWVPFERTADAAGSSSFLGLPAAVASGGEGAASARMSSAGKGAGPIRSTVAGALHVHTELSHDSEGTWDEVAAAAQAAGLGFVLISDHHSRITPEDDVPGPARLMEGVVLVDGREVNLGRDIGRVLVFGVDTTLTAWDTGVDALGEFLERRGGTAIVAHARSPLAKESWHWPETPNIVGWEAFDLSDEARRLFPTVSTPYHALALLASLPLGRADLSLLRLFRSGFDTPGTMAFDSLRMRQPLTAVAGANVHPKARWFGRIVPGYDPFFEAVANHILLDGEFPTDPLAAQDSIAAALAGGRVIVSFGEVEEARAFGLGVTDGGRLLGGVGAEVLFDAGISLRADFGERKHRRLEYRVVRDGVTVHVVRGSTLDWSIPEPGFYRVEVYRYSAAAGALTWNRRPWIFSNPIRVVEAGHHPPVVTEDL